MNESTIDNTDKEFDLDHIQAAENGDYVDDVHQDNDQSMVDQTVIKEELADNEVNTQPKKEKPKNKYKTPLILAAFACIVFGSIALPFIGSSNSEDNTANTANYAQFESDIPSKTESSAAVKHDMPTPAQVASNEDVDNLRREILDVWGEIEVIRNGVDSVVTKINESLSAKQEAIDILNVNVESVRDEISLSVEQSELRSDDKLESEINKISTRLKLVNRLTTELEILKAKLEKTIAEKVHSENAKGYEFISRARNRAIIKHISTGKEHRIYPGYVIPDVGMVEEVSITGCITLASGQKTPLSDGRCQG